MCATSGCVTSGSPTSGPEPGDDVDHALREAGLGEQLASSIIDAEVNSDGLTTAVQPAASAGASFQLVSVSGEFQGVMIATTPFGSYLRIGEDAFLVGRDDRTLDLVGQAGVVLEIVAHVLDLRGHLGRQLAVVALLDLGEAPRIGRDRFPEFPEGVAALRGVISGQAPDSNARSCGLDCALDVLRVASSNIAHVWPLKGSSVGKYRPETGSTRSPSM